MKLRPVRSDARAISPRDLPLIWTEFPDQWAKSKRERRETLRELAGRIQKTRGSTKDELPWLKLGRFGDERTKKGALRSNANMIAICGIELDYDDGDVKWDQAWARLYAAAIPALLYTTRQHTSAQPRFRVLIPTSRPLPPAERARLVSRAYGVVKGTVDAASFRNSQSYYYGAVGEGRIWLELVDPPGGRFIDHADDLDAGALDKHGELLDAEDCEPDDYSLSDVDHPHDLERIKRDLSVISSEDREIWLKVGQALHHEFDGDDMGYDLWDTWSQSSEKHDEDDQHRV